MSAEAVEKVVEVVEKVVEKVAEVIQLPGTTPSTTPTPAPAPSIDPIVIPRTKVGGISPLFVTGLIIAAIVIGIIIYKKTRPEKLVSPNPS